MIARMNDTAVVFTDRIIVFSCLGSTQVVSLLCLSLRGRLALWSLIWGIYLTDCLCIHCGLRGFLVTIVRSKFSGYGVDSCCQACLFVVRDVERSLVYFQIDRYIKYHNK